MTTTSEWKTPDHSGGQEPRPDMHGTVAGGPTTPGLKDAFVRLEKRSYTTYLSRIRAYERLNRRNNAWNASLVSLATSTTIASIGLLVDPAMYGKGGGTLLVALSVLSLVSSLVVSNISYGTRARAMEASYKRIQQISLAAENIFALEQLPSAHRFAELQKEYEVALESSENHTDADYQRSKGASSWKTILDTIVTITPYVTLFIPIALLVPFVQWLSKS